MDKLNTARAELAEFERLYLAAMECWKRTVTAANEWEAEGVRAPLNAPFTPPSTTGDHVRNLHSRGRRPKGKIDRAPELRAFICTHVDQMTFAQMSDAIAEKFPPERRVGKSALHTWWSRTNRYGEGRTAIPIRPSPTSSGHAAL